MVRPRRTLDEFNVIQLQFDCAEQSRSDSIGVIKSRGRQRAKTAKKEKKKEDISGDDDGKNENRFDCITFNSFFSVLFFVVYLIFSWKS